MNRLSRLLSTATAWLIAGGLVVTPLSEVLARKSSNEKSNYDKSSGDKSGSGNKAEKSEKSDKGSRNRGSKSSGNSRDRSERDRRSREDKPMKSAEYKRPKRDRDEDKPAKAADNYKPKRQKPDDTKVTRYDPKNTPKTRPDKVDKKDPKKDPKHPRYSQVPPQPQPGKDPKATQYPQPIPSQGQPRPTGLPQPPRPNFPAPQIALPPIPVIPIPGRVEPLPLPRTAFVPPEITPRGPLPPQGGLPPRRRELPPRRIPSVVPPANDVARKRDREMLIAMSDNVSDGDSIALGNGLSLNVEVQYRSALLGVKLVRLRVPDGRSLTQAIQQVVLANDPRIISVQPNYVFETMQMVAATVPVPLTRMLPQYAPEKIHLSAAHRVALGRDVRVAVIDTGLDSNHPELAGAVADTFDAIGEGQPQAEAHGTAIAGIVASRRQITGMAPDARVLAIRSFATGQGRKPEASTLSLIKGLDWAAANNARVVNMSFAGPKDALLHEAIEQAESRGLVMVAAAGNGGPKAASAYPAAYERVIAVTATDSDDKLYEMANHGTYVAIAAPGVDILTAAPKDAYEMSSGTSLAAAHISGIIALMLERKPDLSTEEIVSILARTARSPVAPGQKMKRTEFGAGIVDAERAVKASQ